MADRNLVVRFIGDDRDLQRAFTNTEKRAIAFEGRMNAVNQGARGALSGFGSRSSLLFGSGAFIGTAAITTGLRNAVDEASALNEEVAKSEQIFGSSSAAVQSWAGTTAREIGISRREALEATGIFGNLFRVIDVGPEQAAALSRTLVELAADLASFNNANPAEVLDAIRSGLIGEAEPLRRYGVLLSEARVQQVALEASGKSNVRQLTDQEKALARYNIILQDTAPAQGDVARTSESFANQTRQLRAQISDLEGELGTVLIPTLTELVTTLNDAVTAAGFLFGALSDIKELAPIELPIDVPVNIVLKVRGTEGGRDLLSGLGERIQAGIESALSAGSQGFENLESLVRGEGGRGFQFFPAPVAAERDETPTKAAADRLEDQAEQTERDAKRARAAAARRQKAFDEFVKGMGLKLDKAQLTAGLDDDIAALEELEAAIQRRIAREGRTFALEEQLTETRLRLAGVREARAEEAAQSAREAYEEIIGLLELDLTRALRTASLEDDLAALEVLENEIRKRIAAEGRTLDLLQDLDSVQARREDVLRQQRERRRSRREERQFEALGLTAEGQRPTPGPGALLRRANTLEDQIKGTVLDTAANRAKLDRIQSVLTKDFDKLGKSVREAILRMLNEISDAMDGGAQDFAPDTRGAKFGVDRLLEGLGLSPEQIKEIRQRFAGIGGSGRTGGFETAPTLRTGVGAGAQVGIGAGAIDLHVTVELDGKQLEATVTKRQEKTRGRNARSRRGVRGGG